MSRKWMMSLALGWLLPAAAMAASSDWNVNEHGVAVAGYDVVAYHTQDRAVLGSSNYQQAHDGATFQFSSAENRELFRQSPGSYVPQFGGFCAFGVAKNHAKVPTDPNTFKIHHGELLLFFNDLYNGEKVNTKIFWNQGEEALYAEAVKSWPTLD